MMNGVVPTDATWHDKGCKGKRKSKSNDTARRANKGGKQRREIGNGSDGNSAGLGCVKFDRTAAAVGNTATWNATADGRAVKESKPFRNLPERIEHTSYLVPLPPSVLSIAPSHIEAIYVMKNIKNHGSPRWKNHLSRMALEHRRQLTLRSATRHTPAYLGRRTVPCSRRERRKCSFCFCQALAHSNSCTSFGGSQGNLVS